MSKPFIAAIGTYDENTTEQITMKELRVEATNVYEAHKTALFKCDARENQIVLRLIEYGTQRILFDHLAGFIA